MVRRKISVEVSDGALATTLLGVFSELVHPAPEAATLFEAGPGWRIEAYFADPCDTQGLARQLAEMLGRPPPAWTDLPVPEENWVALSQAALPPVKAGRFTVHGRHDRQRVAHSPYTIEIEAGEAFGTAHHATTQSCLQALCSLARRKPFRRVLDLGCGSGVLAIAAARSLPRASVTATDHDPLAVRVATANAHLNGVWSRIRCAVANGLHHPDARQTPGYDLVLANILAAPLISLAPAMARATTSGGIAILSGLLITQAPQVIAAYRCAGFQLLAHRRGAGWSTLMLLRRSSRSLSARSCQARGVNRSRARTR
jgi:ribosomal protein L11 methyltransferase